MSVLRLIIDSMEVEEIAWIEEVFQKYRKNYDILDDLFRKKGINSGQGELKVKGEIYYRPAFFDQTTDLTIHSCGSESYPSNLIASYVPTKQYILSEAQKEELDSRFNAFQVNLKRFEEAVSSAKGFWVEYLHSTTWQNYFNQSPRPTDLVLNFTGQRGDVLGALISEYAQQVVEISKETMFKKIDDAENPNIRQGIISDYFLEVFMDKYYSCSHFEVTICSICGREFLPQCNSEWVNRVPPIFCQFCLNMAFSASTDFYKKIGFSEIERKDNFVKGTRLYAEYFGIIPAVGYQKRKVIQQLFQSGVPIDELILAIKVSSLLPWTETIANLYESWAHFLEEVGLLSKRQRGKGGHQSIASDGHLCLSMGERAICEFLTKNGLVHIKEPMYPIDEKLNPNGLMRGDFEVNGLIIEFAGMMSNPDYALNIKNKSKLAKKFGIPWLKLETTKLDELQDILLFLESKENSK